MRIVKLTSDTKNKLMSDLLKRTTDDYGEQEVVVKEIIKNVHDNGDAALFEYTKKFDKADINAGNIKVTDAEIEEAYGLVDGELTIVVGNEPGASLPSTGGPGSRIFTMLGTILALGAGLMLVQRKKWFL